MKRHSGKKHISLLLSFIMIFTTCFLPSSSFAYATEDLSIENLNFSMETSEKCNLGKFKTDLKLESSVDEGTGETIYNLIVPDYDIFYSVPGGTAGKENDRLTTFRIALPDKSNYKLILNFNEVFAGNSIGHSLESDENGVISTDKFLYGQSYDKSFSIEIIPSNENKGKIYTVNVIPEISINTFLVTDAKNKRRPIEASKSVGVLLKPSESEFTTDALAGTKVKVQPSTHSDMLLEKDNKPTYNFTVNGKAEELKLINNTYTYEFTVPEVNTDTVLTFQPKAEGYVSHAPVKLTIKSSDIDYFPDVKMNFMAKKFNVGDTNKKLTCVINNANKEGYKYSWYSGAKVNAMEFLTTTDGPDLMIDTSKPSGKTFYKCEVSKNVDGRIYKDSKNQGNVTVLAKDGTEKIDAPIINNQSGDIKTVVGSSPDDLYVDAEGSRGGLLTYKWYVNDKNSREGATVIEGATKQSYKPETKQEGIKYYFCEVKDTVSVSPHNFISDPTFSNIMTVTVDKDKAFTLEGEGTKEAPYLIKNASDLSQLATFVNEKHFAYSDTHFALTCDITLPKEWTPIGSTKDGSTDAEYGMNIAPFSGIFDGEYNGKVHTVTVPENGLPLFGYVRNAEIRNLNIYGKKIAGYGLINNYDIDYGEDGNYQTGVPKIATIDNVTIKNGTKTLRAGFVGGFGSGENTVEIRNCTAEENVIIGYSHERGSIGSFAGSLNGTMINCKSAADVYGTSNVGGLAGNKGQSMGPCSITNCEFTGNVVATGRHVGGIIGSGYDGGGTAPNTPVVSIKNCLVTGNITGADRVGGILGAEPGCEDCWANGAGSILDSLFTGKIKATKSDSDVGAIIGFLKSINEHQKVGDNYFKDNCGAKYGVGRVELIKTDDFDITKTAVEVTDKQLKDGTVKDLLNKSATSLKNWEQGINNPIHSKEPVAYKLNLSGEYKTDYIVNEEFDNSGIVVTADYSDGSNKPVELQALKFEGFDSSKAGYKDIKVKFGAAETSYRICVKYANPEDIGVSFTLLGDKRHNSDEDKEVHCLSRENLIEWVPNKTFVVNQNNTVKDVIDLALKEIGATCKNPTGNYIESITYKGEEIGQFTNGPKSGWMYTLNGAYPSLGVSEQFLNDGDEIIFHYTDDYTLEKNSDAWNKAEAEKVDSLIDSIGKVTLEKETQINEARAAYEGLPADAQKLVTKLSVLEDAEKALTKLKEPVKPVKPTEKDKEYKKAYNETGASYADKSLGFGEEWPVIGLVRGGYPADKALYEKYYQDVLKTLKNNNGVLSNRKYTEYSRTILALTAAGYDPTNVGGYNLVAKLGDFNKVKAQGPNGSIWALIALDSNKYELPKDATTTREKLIADILANEVAGGGWSMDPEKADVDMTGMAIQALAPYYKTNADVKSAVDRGLAWLSSKMSPNGAFREFGGKESVESTAQVVVALTALGIDPANDARFVKSGKSALDGLMMFYVGNGRFEHLKNTGANGIATEQGFYALASYLRFAAGKTALYDMTDVAKVENPKEVVDKDTTDKKDEAESPKTGDSTNMIPWMLLLIGAAGAVVTVRRKEEK